ncbi:hypothetical protein [Scleromatobacter humisilvae]|uniref:Uncharacterized protein n=1 Tax=Scleromatobacter humisilvae TaxID=2897159 RepID=A0A9X1YM12_9BURK|nr:hypothetical protein [Scleromatobacter humisilvae]MCK9688814.1 hypothetical protein [Scleromatobacter humisilvae]
MRRSSPAARRTALAVGIAALLAAGWWWLHAPAIEHRAVATPPEIDIDPPAMRARREAALALATMPDDPWTFAESLAASAPAAPVKEDCGIAGRPQFTVADGPARTPVQTSGASSRYAAAQARVDAALRASADPLDRAVADLVNVGDMRDESGRNEAFVQQAAVSTDPRLYALAWRMCYSRPSTAPSCGAIGLDRWIQIDADNGVPWLTKLGEAQARGDAAAARTAMSRLASATRFDIYLQAAAGAVAGRAARDDPDLAAVNDLAFKATTVEAGLPLPPFQPLMQACRDRAGGNVDLAQTCRTISDTLFAHSDNLLSQSIGGAVLLQATGDASRRDYIRTERAVARARWSPATGFSECRAMRDSLNALVRTAKVGEVEAMRERARQFVTP